jgi:large subunit ribosomal protein L2
LYRIETRQAVIARSAGTFAQLMARDGKYATMFFRQKQDLICWTCSATITWSGFYPDHQLAVSGKVEQDG